MAVPSPMEQLSVEQRRDLLRVAVVEHLRTYLLFDGPILRRIGEAENRFSDVDMSAVWREYSIFQSTPVNTPKLIAARRIEGYLHGNGPGTGGLLARADHCASLAIRAKQLGLTRNIELSGFTKLCWFLAPRRWPLYDRHASAAIVGQRLAGQPRMRCYYEQWHNLGLLVAARRIDQLLRRYDLGVLFGVRVIDKYLMLCGIETEPKPKLRGGLRVSEVVAGSQHFLGAMPDGWRQRVKTAAAAIVDANAEILDGSWERTAMETGE